MNAGGVPLADLVRRGALPQLHAHFRDNPNAINTPKRAAQLLHTAIRETQQNCTEVLQILLSHRAAVDSVSGAEGLTVLHVAVQLGKAAEVGFLLSKGASLTVKAKDGTDALGFAVKVGNPLLVDLLLKFGANPIGHASADPKLQRKLRIAEEALRKAGNVNAASGPAHSPSSVSQSVRQPPSLVHACARIVALHSALIVRASPLPAELRNQIFSAALAMRNAPDAALFSLLDARQTSLALTDILYRHWPAGTWLRLATACPALTTLSLHNCLFVNAEAVAALCRAWPGLQTLHLRNCAAVGNTCAQIVADQLLHLRSLDVSDTAIDREGVLSLAESDCSLTELNLSGLEVPPATLRTLLAQHAKSLTSLSIARIRFAPETWDALKNLKALAALDMTNALAVKDADVVAFASECATLNVLFWAFRKPADVALLRERRPNLTTRRHFSP